MSIVINRIDRPECCDDCYGIDAVYGVPYCLIAQERISNFDTSEGCPEFCPIKQLVYCKDCTRFKPIADEYGECVRQGMTLTVKGNDFCSTAEKRTEK